MTPPVIEYRIHRALRGFRLAAGGGLAAGAARAGALAAGLARGGALAASMARCGALALLAPVFAGALALAWHTLPAGVVSWDDAADALLRTVRLAGPVAAGIAAWTAIADRRTGLGKLERLAVRSATSRPLGRLAAAAAATWGGYVATALALAGWMTAHGPVAGTVPVMEVLAGAAALACCVTAGFLAGGLVPAAGPPVLPAAAVGAAVWLITALSGPAGPGQLRGSGWPRLLVPPDVHHPLFTQWRPGLFGAELAWFAGLAGAGTLAFCWLAGRRRRFLVAAVIPLVLAVAGAGFIHAERLRVADPQATRLSCQNWPLVICVHPALAAALPQLEPAFTTIAAHLAGTPAAIRRLVQHPAGARPGNGGPHGIYAFRLDELAPGYERAVVASVAAQVAPPCQGTAAQLNQPVRAWLLDTPMPGDASSGTDASLGGAGAQAGAAGPGSLGGTAAVVGSAPGAGSAPERIFGAYTEKQRRHWLRRHYHQLVSCTLKRSDFRLAHAAHPARLP